MRFPCRSTILTSFTALLALLLLPSVRAAQDDRREFYEPGLVVETGARAATCDVLKFTPDGRHLLGAGEDKVVRVWSLGEAGLELDRTLRWPTWREQRGAIFALALSPDREARHVAIAGAGVMSGAVVVIDRATGQVAHALDKDELAKVHQDKVVWSLAFSAAGDRIAIGTDDGSVLVWELKPNRLVRLGSRPREATVNRVRLVVFLDDGSLRSLAQDGVVRQWDASRPQVKPKELCTLTTRPVFRAALSADKKWLAAAGAGAGENGSALHQVEVCSLPSARSRRMVPLGSAEHVQGLALDARGQRLAVGLRSVTPGATFWKDTNARVRLFDLQQQDPVKGAVERPRQPYQYRVDTLAFSPDGQRLAVADGQDHEVELWDISHPDAMRAVQVLRGPGTCLWGVGLSADGRYLGYQTQHAADPDHPNRRGTGPYRVFDLHRRTWALPSVRFEPVLPRDEAGGWKLSTLLPGKTNDGTHWYAVSPQGTYYLLEFDWSRWVLPRCYTFLEARAGKPVRLAVGHLWGVSIYDLDPRKFLKDEKGAAAVVPVSRRLVGHQGEVMALAPSADGKMLVSTGRDQTVAAWSLADWPYQAEFGASFEDRLRKVYVTNVAAGSPAWQAGLVKGDEITAFIFNATAAYDPQGQLTAEQQERVQTPLKLDDCLKRLENPVPGKEFYLHYRRVGDKEIKKTLTTVLQRPLWRFFPSRDGEWVLWRWMDYYYDTSTHGDALVGWQVNGPLEQAPLYFPAQRFHRKFYDPKTIADMLHQTAATPERVRLPDLLPPEVRLEADTRRVKDEPVTVKLQVKPRGPRAVHKPEKVVLWINDFRYKEWPPLEHAAGKEVTIPEEMEVAIPADQLRRGKNRLVLQCLGRGGSHDGGYEKTAPVVVEREAPVEKPTLYVLLAGVVDYQPLAVRLQLRKKTELDLKGIEQDLRNMREVWQKQKALYKEVKFVPEATLRDAAATPQNILAQIAQVGQQARPGDVFVIFLAGHGLSEDLVRRTAAFKARNFSFACRDFDPEHPDTTGLSGDELYQALTRVACHKLVLLSACHSGEVASNPVRDLTPDGVGPVVLSACRPTEKAFCDEASGSFFAQAIKEALDDEFEKANSSRNGTLDMRELAAYVRRRVPEILKEEKEADRQSFGAEDKRLTQNPEVAPGLEAIERVPIAQK